MIGESGFTNTGGVCVEANKSWEAWWEQEQEHLKSTGTIQRCLSDEYYSREQKLWCKFPNLPEPTLKIELGPYRFVR